MNEQAAMVLANGELVPAESGVVPVTCRGLMYGDGCFETFCARAGHVFRLGRHLRRLEEGLEYLGISYPPGLQPGQLYPLLNELLRENGLADAPAVLRLQVWRQGPRGYGTSAAGAGYAVTAAPHPGSGDPVELATVGVRRTPSSALPSRYKFTNGLNYIIAANEARRQGADDALMLTTGEWVAETTIANVFWKRGSTVYTPSQQCDILPGITRATVMDLITESTDMQLQEGEYPLEAVKNADVAWLCNSVRQIAPVVRIDECHFPENQAWVEALQARYESVIEREGELL